MLPAFSLLAPGDPGASAPEYVTVVMERSTKYEMFGCARCEHTQEMREWLEFRGEDFAEFDVEQDPDALARMLQLSGGQRLVPVLVENGAVVQVGWQGRGCVVGNGVGNGIGDGVGNAVGKNVDSHVAADRLGARR